MRRLQKFWTRIATASTAIWCGQALNNHTSPAGRAIGAGLELIVGRISSDFTAPRLLECYQKFMQTMEWTVESSMHDIGRRYAAAHAEYYAPFLSRHAAHTGALPGELCTPHAVSARAAREHAGPEPSIISRTPSATNAWCMTGPLRHHSDPSDRHGRLPQNGVRHRGMRSR